MESFSFVKSQGCQDSSFMFARIHAVILDFDDTVLDTFESRTPCLIQGAADFGYSISVEDVRRVWGKPFRDMILSLMPGVDYPAFYEHYRIVMANHQPSLKLGAKELMVYLKTRGWHIAIVSSSSRLLVQQDLEAVGVLDFVDSVWGQEDSLYHKPDPRVLAPILDHLEKKDLSKDVCVYIGDSTRDYLTARGNGILFFAVTTGQEKPESFLKLGLKDEYIVTTLLDLLDPQSYFMTHMLRGRDKLHPAKH